MIFANRIPSNQIVSSIAKSEKNYKVEFANTDTNSDVYELSVYLRKNDNQHKIRMHIISNVLAYPALEMVWEFDDDEYDIAAGTFDDICREVDNVKEVFSQSMMPVSTMVPRMKEAVRWFSVNHIAKKFMLPLDESVYVSNAPDWRSTIYSNRYPNMTQKEKEQIRAFDGNNTEKPLDRKNYGTRERY